MSREAVLRAFAVWGYLVRAEINTKLLGAADWRKTLIAIQQSKRPKPDKTLEDRV